MGKLEKVAREVSTAVMVALILIFALGSLLPDPSMLSEAERVSLQKNHPLIWVLAQHFIPSKFVSSIPFAVMLALLFVSLFTCTVNRVFFWLRRKLPPKRPPLLRDAEVVEREASLEEVFSQLISRLKQEGWKLDWVLKGKEDWAARLRKGHLGFYASIAFHISLVAITAVGIWGALTSFKGEVVLPEGYPIPLRRDSFVKIYREPKLKMLLPSAKVLLERAGVLHSPETGDYDFYAVVVVDTRREKVKKTVLINQPLHLEGFSMILRRMGFSLHFRIWDRGHLIFDSFVNLMVFFPGDTDSFVVPVSPPIFVGVRLKEWDYSRAPVFEMSFRKGGQESAERFSMSAPGVKRLQDVDVEVSDWKLWASFNVVRDPSYPWAIGLMSAAFLLVAVRFAFPDSVLYLVVKRAGGKRCLVMWQRFSKYHLPEYNGNKELLKLMKESE